MTRSLSVVLLLLSAVTVSAQTVVADRVRLNTGPCMLSSGSGSPEGVVTATCGMYIDTATDVWYTKWTGIGSTGWGVGHNTNATINGTLAVTGNTSLSGFVGLPSYVSQLTGWRIDNAGGGDFRYLYTDELHAKSFIADLEQALAGAQIICKSVTLLGSNFTNPDLGATATLTVRDLPSAENVATFQSGDYVGLRAFTRTAGSLTIADTFGVVTAYADQAGGVQTWTFTRGSGANGGGMFLTTIVATDAIVIDYGVSGNGCHEVNAIDGANSINSPYAQTWTWTTSPITANRTLATRVGNLRGITSVAGEYGMIAGAYVDTSSKFIRASNSIVQLRNIDLDMYSGGTEVMRLTPSVPSFAIGSPTPTGYATGTGIWMGNDGGTYKFRVGNPAGNRMTWDGTTLTVAGDGAGVTNINGASIQTGTVSAAKLTVGSGTNLIRNSECRVGTEDWFVAGNTHALTETISFALSPFRLNDVSNTCYLVVTGTPAAATADIIFGGQASLPVIAGNKYEASIYFGLHRATSTKVGIRWLNDVGVYISESFGNLCTTASPGEKWLSYFCRSGVVTAAPAGAHFAQFEIVTTYDGSGVDPYTFWVRAFLGEALANQTELSPWGGAGITEITGGMIKTGVIVAGHIAANTITAAKIAAGTITATELAANSVTASKINVGTLSAISANIGTVTAGTINGVTITGVTINGTNTLSGTAITGGTIDISNGDFVVDSNGNLQVTYGQFGGLDTGSLFATGLITFTGTAMDGTNRTVCITNNVLYTVASGVSC